MAYERTIWENREVERPRTFEKVENPDGTITLVPAEGNIIESGTPIIAENMNNIEEGIEDVHSDLAAHKADYIHHAGYGTASGTNAKTITLNPAPSGYKEGMTVAFKNITQNTGAVTINVNGLGAKPILKSNGSALSSGNLKAGSIYTVRYNGSNFILQGEGGEYGTAQASDVLEGKTIGTEEGLVTGTMPNRGAISKTITTQGGQIVVPEGYHDGSGIVKAQFANLVPENIKKGVNVGGVVGELRSRYDYLIFGEGANPYGFEVNPSGSIEARQGEPKTSNMPIDFTDTSFLLFIYTITKASDANYASGALEIGDVVFATNGTGSIYSPGRPHTNKIPEHITGEQHITVRTHSGASSFRVSHIFLF